MADRWERPGAVRLAAICIALLALLALRQSHFVLSVAAHEGEDHGTPFEDVSEAVGLTDTRQGDDRAIGQAWGDFDNDGWQDLYVTDTDGPNILFRNVAGERFERVDDPAVALADAYSGGAIFADYDNDGWQDLYVVNWGENVLLRNVEGRFEDVTATAGVGGGDRNSQTASWGDYDEDGFLDLYVANWACYPLCGRPQQGELDRLYHNNGDGTFEDVTDLLGARNNGAGFVASFVDFDNDGDLDIYVVNDEFINPVGNRLYRNDGAGCEGWCFSEIGAEAGADSRLMGMGLATTDYDRDGYMDFFFSNAGPMELLRNQGDGRFVNMGPAAGVDYPEGIGWGTVFLDYDNDGWQDLYIAIMEGTSGVHPGNPLFHNNQDGTFARVETNGAEDMGRSLGVASADYDQDGDIDFVVGSIDTGYKLYRNKSADDAANANNWITFKLIGGAPVNRDAIGTRVQVTDAEGGVQMQDVIAGASLGAGNELALHFGLGTSTAEQVVVTWPDGSQQTFDDLPVNQRHTITYGETPATAQTRGLALDSTTLIVFGAMALVGVVALAGMLFYYRRNRGAA